MRLIIPGGAAIDQRRQPVSSLIKAVSRASDWVRRMEIGECKHRRDLAKATKLEPRYINSILRVAFLAPQIVEAIIDGRQPPDLTLGSLRGVLPMSWQQQKKLISFSYRDGRDRGT
jgi:site-specific DNA recombinase